MRHESAMRPPPDALHPQLFAHKESIISFLESQSFGEVVHILDLRNSSNLLYALLPLTVALLLTAVVLETTGSSKRFEVGLFGLRSLFLLLAILSTVDISILIPAVLYRTVTIAQSFPALLPPPRRPPKRQPFAELSGKSHGARAEVYDSSPLEDRSQLSIRLYLCASIGVCLGPFVRRPAPFRSRALGRSGQWNEVARFHRAAERLSIRLRVGSGRLEEPGRVQQGQEMK
eukprot:Skav231746  [mRNA]  locus=scaffold1584:216851:230224:+ [translate_table: standard]